MTPNTGKPLNDRPVPRMEQHEVGHAFDGQRWNGSAWEPAGAEGVASVPAPRRHHDPEPVVMYPGK